MNLSGSVVDVPYKCHVPSRWALFIMDCEARNAPTIPNLQGLRFDHGFRCALGATRGVFKCNFSVFARELQRSFRQASAGLGGHGPQHEHVVLPRMKIHPSSFLISMHTAFQFLETFLLIHFQMLPIPLRNCLSGAVTERAQQVCGQRPRHTERFD